MGESPYPNDLDDYDCEERDYVPPAQLDPKRPREQVIGWQLEETPKFGATYELHTIVQQAFNLTRVIVPSNLAPEYSIQDIYIADCSQIMTADCGIPARMFDENGPSLKFDTAKPGERITLVVRYHGPASKCGSCGRSHWMRRLIARLFPSRRAKFRAGGIGTVTFP